MIISILNQKGGVGKTTTSVHLSFAFALSDRKTLLIDLDPQANACSTFFSEPLRTATIREPLIDRKFNISEVIHPTTQENLFVIPSNIHLEAAERKIDSMPHREKLLSNQLAKIVKKFDVILIDCPPRLNQLTINAIYAADLLLIPTVLDRYSLDGISDLFQTIEEVKENEFNHFLILKNSYDSREKKSNDIAEAVLYEMKDHICTTTIRRTSLFKQAQQHSMPLFTYSTNSPACADFLNLAKELLNHVC